MMQAVFISDLHLGPDDPEITRRFLAFSEWIIAKSERLYILGDFFHAWPGDDISETWIEPISNALKKMAQSGIQVFFLGGNRDFLVGDKFCREHGMVLLKEPHILPFCETRTLVAHGDRYCTRDRKHQWFRRLTRNAIFKVLFQQIPFRIRQRIVADIRRQSQNNKMYQIALGEVITSAVIWHLSRFNASVLIHGHTHKPALHKITQSCSMKRYVLSDWDDSPYVLCYDKAKGYKFIHFENEVTCA